MRSNRKWPYHEGNSTAGNTGPFRQFTIKQPVDFPSIWNIFSNWSTSKSWILTASNSDSQFMPTLKKLSKNILKNSLLFWSYKFKLMPSFWQEDWSSSHVQFSLTKKIKYFCIALINALSLQTSLGNKKEHVPYPISDLMFHSYYFYSIEKCDSNSKSFISELFQGFY